MKFWCGKSCQKNFFLHFQIGQKSGLQQFWRTNIYKHSNFGSSILAKILILSKRPGYILGHCTTLQYSTQNGKMVSSNSIREMRLRMLFTINRERVENSIWIGIIHMKNGIFGILPTQSSKIRCLFLGVINLGLR